MSSHSKLFKKILGIGLIVCFLVGSVVIVSWANHIAQSQSFWQILLVAQGAEESDRDLLLLSYFPQEKKLKSFRLNPEIKVNVMGGYQEYRLGAVYPLLELEDKSPAFIRASLSQSLGVVLDDVWATSQIEPEAELNSILNHSFWAQTTSFRQKLLLMTLIFRLSVNDLVTESTQIDDLGVLADHNQDLSQYQAVYGLCSVGVINTTPTNRLGSTYAQVLEENGWRVVKVSDDEQKLSRSKLIWSGNSECRTAVERIEKTLPHPEIEKNLETAQENRSELVIFLGEDFIR